MVAWEEVTGLRNYVEHANWTDIEDLPPWPEEAECGGAT